MLGRVGSTLLVIGLALALVSIMPPATSGFYSTTEGVLAPGKYDVLPSGDGWFSSPKTGISLKVSSNSSLHIYLLSTSGSEVYGWAESWIKEHFPNLKETEVTRKIFNVSVLRMFLKEYSRYVLLNRTVEKTFSIDFFPSKVTNIILAISNPSSVSVDYKVRLERITGLAAKEHVSKPAELSILTGIILILPWAIKRYLIRG